MASDLPWIPPAFFSLVAGALWMPVAIGASGAAVWHGVLPAGDAIYLKIADREPMMREVRAEVERLRWLAGKLPVPRVLGYAEDHGKHALLLSTVPGSMTCDEQALQRPDAVVRALAAGLRLIHALPIATCPFDERDAVKLARAHAYIAAGWCDPDDLDADHQGLSWDELVQTIAATLPTTSDLVFTHGDYCLPNVLIDVTTFAVTGFIDWGRAGIADRAQDLALAARSIAFNLGAAWVAPFFMAYGLPEPDQARLAFYRLLDEFF